MLIIYSRSIICWHPNQLSLLVAQTQDSLIMKVISCQILMVTEVLLEPFTISHLQGQTSPSQFTKCANICLHLPQFILLQQNESLDTFKVLSIMVLLLPQVHCISLPTLMQTGQETLMTGVPPQAILSTLALIPFLVSQKATHSL